MKGSAMPEARRRFWKPASTRRTWSGPGPSTKAFLNCSRCCSNQAAHDLRRGRPRCPAHVERRCGGNETVTMPGGMIPGHDGAGRCILRSPSAKTSGEMGEALAAMASPSKDRHLDARRPQHLLPRSGWTLAGVGDAGIVDGVLAPPPRRGEPYEVSFTTCGLKGLVP